MKFIKAEEIIATAENILSIYFEAGSIDNSLLYPQIEKMVESLGVEAKTKTSIKLEVEDYKAKLPDDYSSLILALACTTYKFKDNTVKGIVSYETKICRIPKCKSTCDYGRDSKGLFQIYQHIEDTTYTHQDIEVLSVSSGSVGCDACENPRKKDKYDIEIKDGYIHTQFKSGSIYMEYRATEEDLLVPDYVEIKDWIEAEIIAFVFKRMWYVMDGDVYNRFQYSQQEAGIKKHNALSFWRRSKPSDYKKLRQELIRNSKKISRL